MPKTGRPSSNPSHTRKPWGLRIASARDAAKLSQEKLAEAIGKSQTQVGAYESGKSEPDLATFEAIGKACLVSPKWLAFGDPPDGDPLVGAIIESSKQDRLFAWTFHRAARLLSEEGLDADLTFTVAYTRKLMGSAQGVADDVEAKERISSAIEIERAEIRRGLDKVRKDRI